MTRAIVIPTWRGHFEANLRFLRSYAARAQYPQRIPVRFVVSNPAEAAELRARFAAEPALGVVNIEIHAIPDILQRHGVDPSQAQAFRVENFENKYSYQSIKKLYGVLDSAADQVLVLDSEAYLWTPTDLDELFDRYFAAPFVFVSSTDNEFLRLVNRSSLLLVDPALGRPDLLHRWVFEYPAWFFEKKTLAEFIAEIARQHGRPVFEVLSRSSNVFEVIGYYWFIYLHREAYPAYRFWEVAPLLEEALGPAPAADFLALFRGRPHGILEHYLFGLTESNFENLSALIQRLGLHFVRIESFHAGGNMALVRRFIRHNPTIRVFACSDSLSAFISPPNAVTALLLRLARFGRRAVRFTLRKTGLSPA